MKLKRRGNGGRPLPDPVMSTGDLNEDMLDQENLGNVDTMETDGDNIKIDEVVETSDIEDEFQDLTDEEIDGNQVALKGNTGTGLQEKCEEGEIEKEENAVEVEQIKGIRKKPFKSVPLIGGTTKKRMVQALVSPCKRQPNKTNSKQGDGMKQGAEQGPFPKPPINKN
ncbi:hypothetical protein Bca52824_016152 [Brassica carinata]|uniref:Uncharacterized protein n=1 Tax=Brassica carinata TaxID=52824 RepID=A0A8X7W4K0_BRACI|nr:hypothetical protein Bca52824_016152 [Brassica carinata]